MDRKLQVGDPVVYVDEQRVRHHAIVTVVWDNMNAAQGCNLVFVSSDETKTDPYGRQIERRSSTCHFSVQPAKANCWAFADEL